jgi:CRISPR-associated endonuclease/helicase Cas3
MTAASKEIVRFWAKTTHDIDKHPNAFHPLICHMIDVACVTLLMWQLVLPLATKKRITKAFGYDPENDDDIETVGRLVAFIAGLHDLGKCSPPFQFRGKNDANGYAWLENRIKEEIHKGDKKDYFYLKRLNGRLQTIKFLSAYEKEFLVPDSIPPAIDAPHGYVTTIELPEILESYGFNSEICKQVSILIGGHHGIFPGSEWSKGGRKAIDANLGENWQPYRKELTQMLAEVLDIKPIHQDSSAKLDNGTIMILAGLVSVADWIGSNPDFFRCEIENFESDFELDIGSYFTKATGQARDALKKLGWSDWAEYDNGKEFFELFPKLKEFPLRALQTEAIELAKDLKSAGIVVIESPMGEGKTEAAMFLADHFNCRLKHRGIYFALPTQATSNQMFGRITDFLEKRFDRGIVQAQLLHGHAGLSSQLESLKRKFDEIQDIYEECSGEGCVPAVVASEWFAKNGKQGLLVPFGVGTVDQALMAVLQTKHVFVRLFGLAHKTVIIDEVHAYDVYMSTLLERLLEWLAALGSPVILLSATLPIERRNKLIQAYQRGLGVETGDVQAADYPRISYATDSTINVRHIESSAKTQVLHIDKIDEILANDQISKKLICELENKLKNGGCVAIICNTVRRSQEIYEQLSKVPFLQGNDEVDGLPILDLLHSRFRFRDRDQIETRVRIRFGKPGDQIPVRTASDSDRVTEVIYETVKRPKCAVLVATQIIEQSLDIDFDLMISDLAPIDLILQRSGRLHRHNRDNRPETLKTPDLWLIKPELDENGSLKPDKKGLPDFGKSGFVYDKHILLRTWIEVNKEEYSNLEIPKQVEELIEAVYNNKLECADATYQCFWDDSKTEMNEKLKIKKAKAKVCRITDADDEDLFENVSLQLDEDNPETHKTLQALTRDEEIPSVSVIILTKQEAEGIDFSQRPQQELVEFLLNREAKISKCGITNLIIDKKELKQKGWQKSPLLRHHRLIDLNNDDEWSVSKFKVSLNCKLGIVITKTGEEND